MFRYTANSTVMDGEFLEAVKLEMKSTPDEKISLQSVCGLQEDAEFIKKKVLNHLKSAEFCDREDFPDGPTHILLCGHPGTGKTIFLKAFAKEAGVDLFVFNLYCLGGLLFKDPAKAIKVVFQVAQSNTPCILCLEDIDCLSKCDEKFREQVVRDLKARLGSLRSQSGCVVISITQRPWAVDPDLLALFECRVFKMPTAEARLEILKLHMEGLRNGLTQDDLMEIAQRTEGFTGADLSILMRSAAMGLLREVFKAEYFRKIKVPKTEKKKVDSLASASSSKAEQEATKNTEEYTASEANADEFEEKLTPCEADEDGAIQMNFDDIKDTDLLYLEYDVTRAQMLKELEGMKPGITAEEEAQMYKFWKECCEGVKI